jgi:hypothetical protein
MEIHPSAMAAWVPYFVRVSNRMSGIDRLPTLEEIAAHRGLFATNALRVENLEVFVGYIAKGARLRDEADLGIYDDGLVFRVDPKVDLATIVTAVRTLAAPPQRLHRLYSLLHPFTDGNARCGRALLMWQIVRRSKAREPTVPERRRATSRVPSGGLRPQGLPN